MGNFPQIWHRKKNPKKALKSLGFLKVADSKRTQCQVESQSRHITVFHTSPRQKMFQATFQQRAGDHYVTGKSI